MKTRVLPVIGALFAVILISRSVALSSEVSTAKADNHKETLAKPEHTEQSPEDAAQHCVTGEVLKAINAKMDVMKLREAEMAEKETAFTAIRERLQKELAIVESAKNSLAKGAQARTELAQNDITHLTTMYSTMKPKQAAQIFNKMNSGFAAGFLREMKGQRAGLILAAMDAKKAYEISLVLASRNAKYRKKQAMN